MDTQWQGSVKIKAPVEEVYRYLADLPKHCEWAQTLVKMEEIKPGDSTGVGVRYRTTERQAMQSDRKPREELAKGFKGTTICEVRELVPNTRVAWHAYATPRMGVSSDHQMELAPDGEGGTLLTQRIAMHEPALPTFIFRKLVFKMGKEEMKQRAAAQWQSSLDNIKTILEERATKPATNVA